jgi:hypothetical protein
MTLLGPFFGRTDKITAQIAADFGDGTVFQIGQFVEEREAYAKARTFIRLAREGGVCDLREPGADGDRRVGGVLRELRR